MTSGTSSVDEPRGFEVKDGFLATTGSRRRISTMRMRSLRAADAYSDGDGDDVPSIEAQQLLEMAGGGGPEGGVAQIDGVWPRIPDAPDLSSTWTALFRDRGIAVHCLMLATRRLREPDLPLRF